MEKNMKVSYEQNGKIAYFNGYKFTRDDRTHYYLSSHPIEGKRKRLHVYVWEYFNGPIQKGYQIHHIDEDKSHNDIDNLRCISLHDHMGLHSSERLKDEEFKKVFHERGIETAKEWHKSEAGHDWHKAHYEKMKDKLYIPHEFTCEYCGKKFMSTNTVSKFCCNAHKTYARAKSGVDNINAVCVICGKTFIKNKYEKTCTCGRKCGREKSKLTRMAKVI